MERSRRATAFAEILATAARESTTQDEFLPFARREQGGELSGRMAFDRGG